MDLSLIASVYLLKVCVFYYSLTLQHIRLFVSIPSHYNFLDI
jgi:hypothetical protein